MNNITTQLKKLKDQNRIGLMTHVVVGYPFIEATVPLIKILADVGSDFIELQIPFSDPIADGPTIMMACDIALQKGLTVQDCLEVMKQASKIVSVPLIFMGYYNSVLQYGVERFCLDAKRAGASGLIIPDMPPDEESHEGLIKYAKKYDLDQIRVVTPASSDERLQLNAKVGTGFVYCVSHFGITGSEATLDHQFGAYIKRVRKFFDIPIAVGFGISKKENVDKVRNYADIVVVGSAIIKLIEKSDKVPDSLVKIKSFLGSLVKNKKD